MQDLKPIVRPFYTQILNAKGSGHTGETIEKLIADSFEQINTAETKTKSEFKEYVPGLFALIPDLYCDIQEMLQDDNRVIVRCIASGSPRGNFFGIETDGTKTFRIMTIDIHTVENGQITKVYHLEEWTAAFGQLQS